MKYARIILCLLGLLLTACAGKGAEETETESSAEEVSLWQPVPAENAAQEGRTGDFQVQETFAGEGGSLSFSGWHGQGHVELTCSADCGPLQLFVNGIAVEAETVPGQTAVIDISAAAKDGENLLEVKGPGSGSVRIGCPYPEVLKGTPEEAGIPESALDLIDRIVASDVRHGFPAAQLAIFRNGRLVNAGAWGNVRTYDENGNPVQEAPVTETTLFDLASNTKMYGVNYALQYLVTRNRMDLDAKVTDILGTGFADETISISYAGYAAADLETQKAWKAGMTLKNLLRHEGGFPPGPHYYNDRYDHSTQEFDSDAGNVIYVGTARGENAREETKHAIFRTPLLYEPGTQTLYSDVDYMVLCYCIEEITGRRLDDFLREIFWEPMGLSHICYNPLANGFARADCAATELMGNTRDGHLRYTGIRRETVWGEVHDPNAWYCMDGVSGHAGLFANAGDLARLEALMLTGGEGDTRFFSPEVIAEFTAQKSGEETGYGLGWWRQGNHQRDSWFGQTASEGTIGHQGFTGTLTVIDPELNLCIAFLTNMIHTRIKEGDPTLGKYLGTFYASGSLGFASEILERAIRQGDLSDADCREIVEGLLGRITGRAEREGFDPAHFEPCAALREVLASYQ